MTDMRERVARAISGLSESEFDTLKHDTHREYIEMSDAALLACGYAEMRKALELVVHEVGWHGNGEKDSEQFYCEHCDQTNENYTMIAHKPECIVAVARSILERTGEK